MHPPFSDKCYPTIFSSTRSFAVFFFSQATIFPKKSLKVPFFLPRLWFSIHICIFHHFPPKRLGFSMIFPPFVVVPRSTGAPPVSHHDVGRGKGLGKDAGAAQAGEVRLIRLAAQVGAPWGWWWPWPGWWIFIQFYLGFLGFSEFRGWTVLNQVFWGMILGEETFG